jgi:hypothetical protein
MTEKGEAVGKRKRHAPSKAVNKRNIVQDDYGFLAHTGSCVAPHLVQTHRIR